MSHKKETQATPAAARQEEKQRPLRGTGHRPTVLSALTGDQSLPNLTHLGMGGGAGARWGAGVGGGTATTKKQQHKDELAGNFPSIPM